ncbi:unnamed protein product [Ostreobium quekettii]|uniref:EamA domain-containing protein n=1 Tax=Ostreobium quekettii TaxID=121088 RepID=A0A8S1JG12_9CHLO|nr:unnamed protein product [Ostreobium quekettii]|eukprot:evm.model.scf_2834.1 EVM.evm.TU.scf_2834.1   scf_2834:8925-17555(+)
MPPPLPFPGCLDWAGQQVAHPNWRTTHSLLFLAQLAFSGMHVMSNPALHYLPPLVFAAIRLSLALPFLFLTSKQEGEVTMGWRDNAQLLVLGITGVAIPQSIIFVANELGGAGLVGILTPLSTVFTAALAGLLGLERIGLLKMAGVGMAAVGAALVAVADGGNVSGRSPWAAIAMIANTFSYALYTNLMYLFLIRKPHPFTAYFKAVTFGLLCILPAAVAQARFRPVDWRLVPYWVWYVEIYVGVVVTSGAHAMIAWVVQHVAPVLPGVYGALTPALTVGMAALFLGERFQLGDIGCVALILTGMLLVLLARFRDSKANVASQLPEKAEAKHVDGDEAMETLLGVWKGVVAGEKSEFQLLRDLENLDGGTLTVNSFRIERDLVF